MIRAAYRRWRLHRFVVGNRLAWWQRKPPTFEFLTTIYEGRPRSGKTLRMVYDCVRFLRRGFRVYSNIAIVDPVTGLRTGACSSWLDVLVIATELLEERVRRKDQGLPPPPGVIFAFDEIHEICDASEWQRTPRWFTSFIRQRGHFGVGIIGTSQALDQVVKSFRTLVDLTCRVYRPYKRVWLVQRIPFFVIRELDTALFDLNSLDPACGKTWWKLMPWWVYAAYSTQELVIGEEWASFTDKEIQAKIADLTERAQTAASQLGCEPLIFEYDKRSFEISGSDPIALPVNPIIE